MKMFISLFTVAFFLCFSAVSNAQVSAYTFGQSAGTYTEIAGDTTVAVATATTGDTLSIDNVNYQNNALPFLFFFNDLPYSSFNINSNGFISFDQFSRLQTMSAVFLTTEIIQAP